MAVLNGVDFNYYQEIVVSGGTFPTNPQCLIQFRGNSNIKFLVTAGTVDWSFNGNTVHGSLSNTPALFFDYFNISNRKIWLKGTGTIKIWVYQTI